MAVDLGSTFKELIDEINSKGGSVQPDYNQNDSTASDYIKNRPFYGSGEVILLEQTFTTTLNDNNNIWESDSTVQLTAGDTVKVIFNGTE